MIPPRKLPGSVLLLTCLALLGCADEKENPVTPQVVVNFVGVEGTVTEVVDWVPVDGGATITITTERGDTENLLFPSLFTDPPPSQETVELYDVVRQVEVGDRVRATGERTERGLELHTLVIL